MKELRPGQIVGVGGRAYRVARDPDAPPRIYCGQRDRFRLEEVPGGGGIPLAPDEQVRVGAAVYRVVAGEDGASLRYLYVSGIE